jgi:glycosyltransferase involved in cell wall biosynthesis
LAGDGPLRPQLLEHRAALQIQDIVDMPGAATQKEVLSYWQQATVGILSSHNEGMPLCLMEAAACGVPVIAPAVGGIPELVKDGFTGLLTKPGDAQDLANALEMLLKDEELRLRMGAAARARAKEHFSVERQVNELQKVWSQALARVAV